MHEGTLEGHKSLTPADPVNWFQVKQTRNVSKWEDNLGSQLVTVAGEMFSAPDLVLVGVVVGPRADPESGIPRSGRLRVGCATQRHLSEPISQQRSQRTTDRAERLTERKAVTNGCLLKVRLQTMRSDKGLKTIKRWGWFKPGWFKPNRFKLQMTKDGFWLISWDFSPLIHLG